MNVKKESKTLDVMYRLSDRYATHSTDANADANTISPLDYTAHIRHVNSHAAWIKPSAKEISPRVLEYLRREEKEAGEGAEAEERFEELVDKLPPGFLDRVPTKWDFILMQFQVTLFREVVW